MLEGLFGNSVIEKVLFYLLANRHGYATELKEALGISLNSVQIALSRLEHGGVLVRQSMGKTKLYQFNPRYPFLDELRAFLTKAYSSVPVDMRSRLYERPIRKRPRRKGKPL
jgi:predicted transcriptional regulator